jgi:hypothetical protein
MAFGSIVLAPAARAAETSRVYHIGNSLTNQTVTQANSLSSYAALRGIDITYGFHIRCGMGLGYISTNPDDVCVGPSSFGNYTPALTGNAWDAVTLQTYGDTYDVNKTAIRKFIDLTRGNAANAGTKFYIFEGWAQNLADNGVSYSSNWLSTYDPANPVGVKTFSRGYSNELMRQLRVDNPTVDIRRVPTGEVFYQLDQLARAGQLGSTTGIEQWYGDPNHMGDFGAYTSQITMLAALYGQNPAGLPAPSGMTPEVAAAVQQTVWNVVSSDPFTSAVPEPSGIAVLGIAATAVATRRRRARAAR